MINKKIKSFFNRKFRQENNMKIRKMIFGWKTKKWREKQLFQLCQEDMTKNYQPQIISCNSNVQFQPENEIQE